MHFRQERNRTHGEVHQTYTHIYVELSFGFRARDDSSLAFAIMMFNKGCIYIKLYFFTKFDK